MSNLTKTIKELEVTVEELTKTIEKLKSIPKRGMKPKRGDIVRCESSSMTFNAIFLYESNGHESNEYDFYCVIAEMEEVPQRLPVTMFKLEKIGDGVDFDAIFDEFREEE